MMNKFIKDYLTFSKKDRNAIFVLIALFIVITIVPKLLPSPKTEITPDDLPVWPEKTGSIPTDTLPEESPLSLALVEREESTVDEISLFYFDPNETSREDWQRLGVDKKTIRTIKNYLAKGGRFRQPEDILKIYNINHITATRLIPFIRISAKTGKADTVMVNPPTGTVSSSVTQLPKKTYHRIDINNADTLALSTLPGIGVWRARMIVNLRESLGGFVSADQLSGVWFLPDSVFVNIRPWLDADSTSVRKINVNNAKVEEMARHPYFGRKLAGMIIAYREQHGRFNHITELMKLHGIDKETFARIEPYLAIK